MGPGKTMEKNRYPEGIINNYDQGELSIKIMTYKNKVVIDFGKSIKWVGMGPDMAVELALAMIKHAKEIGLKRPITIDL